ncbi:SixA phosphatase family protein [Luteimonas salinilitoris]|uniref:Histidine phosphatase family protein n=1 Tax=Luteimonas salinilitoris TaxID=3237697 RepID=A0ABV4HU81_9GAMM
MRELILLRHAHAEPAAPGRSDLDRPLSADGHAEAEAAARWLQQHKLIPDCVLCSPARRTRESLEIVLATLGYVDQRLELAIYDATPGTLAALVDAHRDVDRLLLVGHNPGLERLAALLHSGQSGDYRGIPPGGIAVLEFATEAAIEPGAATLSAFWWP